MHDIDLILLKIRSGEKIRIVQDRYGQERIEMKRWWLPLKVRVELPRDEMNKVKEALSTRSRKGRTPVPVTF